MTLNEKLSQILAIAEDDRRQESVQRAEKQKPKLIDKLMSQAKKGRDDGVLIDDSDRTFVKHLSDYFKNEGFTTAEVEPNRVLVTVTRR